MTDRAPAAAPTSLPPSQPQPVRPVSVARPLALLLLAPLLMTLIVTLWAVVAVTRAGGDQSVIGAGLPAVMPYLAAVNHTLLFGLLVLFLKRDGLGLRDIGWKLPGGWSLPAVSVELVVALVAGVLIWLLQTEALEPLIHWLKAAGELGDARFRGASLRPGAAALVAGTLFAGVVEESVWRGYAVSRFAARWSAGVAVALSSVLFGLLHWGLGWEGVVITGINGALLAGLFLWRKNLLAPAVAHAAVNALVLIF